MKLLLRSPWLFLAAIFSTVAFAQPTSRDFMYVSVDPAGACSNGVPNQYNFILGKEWGCKNGTWTLLASGGTGASPAGSLGACQFFATSSTFGGDATDCVLTSAAPSTPAAPTVTKTCTAAGMETCMTTTTYAVAREVIGVGIGSPNGTVTLSADTINATNFNTITPPACTTNQLDWWVWRTSGGNPGYLGTASCGGTFVDNNGASVISFTVPANSTSESSFGLRKVGSIRDTGSLIVGPDVMYRQSTFGKASTFFLATLNDGRDVQTENMATGTGGGSTGYFNVFSLYNANITGNVKAKIAGEEGFDAHLLDNGTMVFEDWSVLDWPNGNNLIFCSFTSNVVPDGCAFQGLQVNTNTASPFVLAKTTVGAVAPGAGFANLRWVAGTNAGTCKLVSNAGTSATEVTIVDNVGSGC